MSNKIKRMVSVVDRSGNSSDVVGEPQSDVNFYDYDGTIIQSYTKAEFVQLTALPKNPSHTGLTAQGWNWELI